MKAIPETLTALARLARSGNTVVAGTLAKLGEEVPAVVSDIVGVSLGLLRGSVHLHDRCQQ